MMSQQSVQNQQTRFLISDVQSQFRAQVPPLASQQHVVQTPAAQAPVAPQASVAPQTPQLPLVNPGQTGFIQHNGSIIVNRAANPDSPFGKSKTGFEDKIISGMEICQHTISKLLMR